MLMKPHQSAGGESGASRCKTILCTNRADTLPAQRRSLPACLPVCPSVCPSVSQRQQIHKSSLPPSHTEQRRSSKETSVNP